MWQNLGKKYKRKKLGKLVVFLMNKPRGKQILQKNQKGILKLEMKSANKMR